jgi:cyclopropane-fatty-acyl-phospholipid synthase
MYCGGMEKKLLDAALKRTSGVGLKVTYWDGQTVAYGPAPAEVHVTFKDAAIVQNMIKNVSLGVGEAYMEGQMVVDGPLDRLLYLGHLNADKFDSFFNKARLGKLLSRNVKQNQAKMIEYHYDLGNEFYELWLDRETLGYTCGYYKSAADTLEQGQVQKFDHILRKLQLKRGMRLLDIGFGWGYLLIRAAKKYGVSGTGVSLSREQLKYAQAWAKREGVDDKVDFRLMNYQDLPNLEQQYDRVVSIGFLEHVGHNNHATYFKIVHQMLVEGGVSLLHCITQQTERPRDAWLDRYIFPGGYIPSVRSITSLLADYDMRLFDYENIGQHYAPTLKGWWNRFEQHRDQIVQMYGDKFYRMWRFYLAGSMAAFQAGTVDLSQWTFTKGLRQNLPLTRENLYR